MKHLALILVLLAVAARARADWNTSLDAPQYAYWGDIYTVTGYAEETDNDDCTVEVSVYKGGYLMAYDSRWSAYNTPTSATASFNDSGGGEYSAFMTNGSGDWLYATTEMQYNPHTIPFSLVAGSFTSASFLLTWQGYPSNADYEVSRDGTSLGTATGLTRSITGLQTNQTYAMRVRCYNESQWSDWSQPLSVTVPDTSPPTPPVAANPSNVHSSGFTANWSTPTGATAYLLDVSSSSAFSSFVSGYQSRNVGNVSSYQVAGLSENVTHYYRIRAIFWAGTSINSNLMAAGTIDGILISSQTYSPVSNTTYTIPTGATRVRVVVAGGGGLGGHGNDCNDWSANGGGGGYASALYATTGGQVISITDGVTSSVAVSASISNGFTVSATVGGNAHPDDNGSSGVNGSPGQGSYDSAYGYVAGSGSVTIGGGGAGGVGCANESGQPNSITIRGYAAPTAPAISSQPQSLSAPIATGVTFFVGATGNPAPAYQWRRNGSNIIGATNNVLAIGNVQSGSAGNYDVLVFNAAGLVTSNAASLTVADSAPSAPAGLNYADRTATTITLIWGDSSDDVGVSYYNVYRGGTLVGSATDVVFADTGLSASTSYSYTVKAVDTAGQLSSASNTLTLSTTASSSADSDNDGIPNLIETALGTSASSSTYDSTNQTTKQVVHRPIQ